MCKVILAENGKACMPVAVEKGAGEVILNAAKELAHYLRRITGAKFEVEEAAAGAAVRLTVDTGLEEEEFVIQTGCDGLTIAGGTERGVLYGVYGLLEDVLGCRFYAHDVTKLPKLETLALENLKYRDKPALEYRQLDYPLALYPEWRARNRLNGQGGQNQEMKQYGGVKTYALFVHTFNRLVPPEVYFDEHPEYYSMVDGKRIRERSQLCLTNPEVIAIAAESVRRLLRENPDATLISVSQNDCYNPCECPECAKVDAENGSHAGTLIQFVNAIAEAIEEEFPHVVVDTLAYQYTRTPPRVVKPRHNVCVRLCSIECCFGHPLETCNEVTGPFKAVKKTSGSSFQEDLIGWGKICSRIYIWDYVTNYLYYWLPFPNFHVLGPNVRFFVKNGVKGVYEEGNHQSVSPDMTEMRSWLLAKLLWNPDFDVKQGIHEFTENVYGPAAGEIRAYIELLEKRVTEGNIHFGIYESPDIAYLDADTVQKAQQLMAEAQAKELTLSQRLYVEKAALSVEFVAVCHEILRGNVDAERIDALADKGRTLGISRLSEGPEWNVMCRRMREGCLKRISFD